MFLERFLDRVTPPLDIGQLVLIEWKYGIGIRNYLKKTIGYIK